VNELTFVIAATPPSLNMVGAARNWRTWHRHKKRWQGDVEAWLMLLTAEHKLPARLEHAAVSVRLRFPVRRRRDTGNFQALLEKAIGDALVGDRKAWPTGRWLPDDTPELYAFTGLEFDPETGPGRTAITLSFV
jgi:hypothetical protein